MKRNDKQEIVVQQASIYELFSLLMVIIILLMMACCNNEIEPYCPKRNIFYYTVTDRNSLDNGSTGDEIAMQLREICRGWQPGNGELLIYTDQTDRLPCLLRINETKNADGLYGIDTVYIYPYQQNSASADVLHQVILKVVSEYPADSYGMIFFSHASGWLPEGTLNKPRSLIIDGGDGAKFEMEYYDFASAIPDKQFDFILFDACFMADAAVMYELRNKADYVLVSSAEVVSPGFTYIYQNEIMRLFDKKNAVESVVIGFGQSYTDLIKTLFHENSVFCSTTFSVIKLDEMQHLAATIKMALNGKDIDETTLDVDNIQRFDRPNALISVDFQRRNRYFDLGHAMETLLTQPQYDAFDAQMKKTIVWKDATKRFLLANYSNGEPNYSEYNGFFINNHSGLSIYIQQEDYPFLNNEYKKSSWYKALR